MHSLIDLAVNILNNTQYLHHDISTDKNILIRHVST